MSKKRTWRFKHKLYREADQKIRDAISRLFKNGKTAGINAIDISREAGINKTTFNAHYGGVENAVTVIDRNMARDFGKIVDEVLAKKMSLEMGFLKLLAFVAQNKNYFTGAMVRVSGASLSKVCKYLKPFVTAGWSNYDAALNEQIFSVYCGEILGVVWYWGKHDDFNTDKIDELAKHLARLTRSASTRLGQALSS